MREQRRRTDRYRRNSARVDETYRVMDRFRVFFTPDNVRHVDAKGPFAFTIADRVRGKTLSRNTTKRRWAIIVRPLPGVPSTVNETVLSPSSPMSDADSLWPPSRG